MMMENENKIYTASRILIRLGVRLVKNFLFTYLSARKKRNNRREITKQQEMYPERYRQFLLPKSGM